MALEGELISVGKMPDASLIHYQSTTSICPDKWTHFLYKTCAVTVAGRKGARNLTCRSICWLVCTNRHLNIMKGVVSLAKHSLWLCHSNLFQLMEFQPFPIITIPYYGNLICIINSSSHRGLLPSFHSLSVPVPYKHYLVVRK